MLDKYGTGQDPYCYPDSKVLVNKLNILDEPILEEAERELSELASQKIEFTPPPYSLETLKQIHHTLFIDLYDWAGQVRTVDVTKSSTRFCNVNRIEPEANKCFKWLSSRDCLESHSREEFINALSEFYGDLNMVHPFREGNGRAIRVLIENIVINRGWEISWASVNKEEWVQANINSVFCDYDLLISIFSKCIGKEIS
ncbi:Fic/DOC family protein [Zooshikella ganghwensis]|uniref:protein adenylyltransferase n=1 Tax=Zooshikella ganghwensis TaxID=202772 RepID=A0A4P9VIS6_9GAMM|nr:Fic family protein [Zooshikella ganghwensis]RDH41476.1 cell filamentation protein Fic [Zooshikella ganghwensis]RDH41582.1 cell filamentation protein Fic [Zooshikella ganghwensis]